jgi:valyl-tRNA synthetase
VYLDWLENIRPWCVSRQLWWGHQLPVWYCDACDETYVAEVAPERCGLCEAPLRRDPDVLDTWFSSALWPFATLGWPADTPQLRSFYPTQVLSTARDIIFLWVARMVMMGIEFTGEPPFADVPIHSVIQAPDGRRMSKSLGTGIDPLELIDEHGADALRFGLLAMSSSQDVKFSPEKVRQGRGLANKLWNASRLVLLRVAETDADGAPIVAAPRPRAAEDRWVLSRLERTTRRVTERVDSYDFAHAALQLYSAFWDEVCDWYLEMVKPRLYDEEADRSELSATLLWVLERSLTLLHPIMPFVTEEVWSYLPGGRELLAVSPWPVPDDGLLDPDAERTVGDAVGAVTALRRYRDDVGVPDRARLSGRLVAPGYEETAAHVARLARFDLTSTGNGRAEDEILATVPVPGGEVLVLPSAEVEEAGLEGRRAARREQLDRELERARGKLANEQFVAKAPPRVVAAEREKLARLEEELARLDG